MTHGGFKIKVAVVQVLRDDSTGDRPGNEPEQEVVHQEWEYALGDIDFSAALAHPVAAVLDLQAYDVAVKMGEDVDEADRARREQRHTDLQAAAAVVRGGT